MLELKNNRKLQYYKKIIAEKNAKTESIIPREGNFTRRIT